MDDVIWSGHLTWQTPPHVVIYITYVRTYACVSCTVWRMTDTQKLALYLPVLSLSAHVMVTYFVFFPEGHIYLELYQATSGNWCITFFFSLWETKIISVNKLKENMVMPGPIFILFSLPPCWLYFLIGISGLALSNPLQKVPFIK